ncbi:MAG: rod shape-determining protein RodA [Verrucomicrobia bacterium]|nr:rod shape-determining protein RodA [Verrucomicrobiota bacterium]
MIGKLEQDQRVRLDWLQIIAVLGLLAVGAAFIHSATATNEVFASRPWFRQPFFLHIVYGLVGLAAATVVCMADYRWLARWSLVAYWACMLLLLGVFVVGKEVYGARRWIDFGPVQIQPSEFAKIGFIFMMANFLSRPLDELRQPGVFWKAIGLMLLPFLLILKEPDLGSALLFLPVGLVMLWSAGAPQKWLIKLVGGGVVLITLLLVDILFAPPSWRFKLEDYQRRRLLVYFGMNFAANAPEAERARLRREQRAHSYNVEQALISVGSGGWLGKGWGQGQQITLGYLPRAVAHNDFIFSVIAEEKGFLGSFIVISLYSVVLFTGIRNAAQARDRLGRLLAAGVVTLLFSQIFINIGMNIRIMPVTGVPLPLLSSGGSSVLCSLIAMGLLQNIHLYRRNY